MNIITIRDDKDYKKLKKSYKEYTRINVVGEVTKIDFTPDNAYYDVHGSAVIESVHGSAVIESVHGSAVIADACGLSSVLSVGDYAQVNARGNVILRIIGKQPNIKIKTTKSVHVVKGKEQVKSIDWFVDNYPVEEKGKTKLILYKAVHKKGKKYVSDYDASFEYKIGQVIKEELAERDAGSCASGIHVSHKLWALKFGADWDDLAILECEVNKKDGNYPLTTGKIGV